jgi:hypothetical protein
VTSLNQAQATRASVISQGKKERLVRRARCKQQQTTRDSTPQICECQGLGLIVNAQRGTVEAQLERSHQVEPGTGNQGQRDQPGEEGALGATCTLQAVTNSNSNRTPGSRVSGVLSSRHKVCWLRIRIEHTLNQAQATRARDFRPGKKERLVHAAGDKGSTTSTPPQAPLPTLLSAKLQSNPLLTPPPKTREPPPPPRLTLCCLHAPM